MSRMKGFALFFAFFFVLAAVPSKGEEKSATIKTITTLLEKQLDALVGELEEDVQLQADTINRLRSMAGNLALDNQMKAEKIEKLGISLDNCYSSEPACASLLSELRTATSQLSAAKKELIACATLASETHGCGESASQEIHANQVDFDTAEESSVLSAQLKPCLDSKQELERNNEILKKELEEKQSQLQQLRKQLEQSQNSEKLRDQKCQEQYSNRHCQSEVAAAEMISEKLSKCQSTVKDLRMMDRQCQSELRLKTSQKDKAAASTKASRKLKNYLN
eukprot:TRINITY_DN3067_c0_g1_i1.p1 TRINITY_DN3067_c0_g1~~TRINITY_DN3067_c0_g1_i1.p1  ORF type:complete len:292 (-),score=61.67 TRINITY_DN3067_c0_g1_i1:28-864(-)